MSTENTIQRLCQYNSEDAEYLDTFSEQVAMLTGMVNEIIVQEPRMLLSPVMRRLLSDKAAEVEALHGPLRGRLVVDNLGGPLKPYKKEA